MRGYSTVDANSSVDHELEARPQHIAKCDARFECNDLLDQDNRARIYFKRWKHIGELRHSSTQSVAT